MLLYLDIDINFINARETTHRARLFVTGAMCTLYTLTVRFICFCTQGMTFFITRKLSEIIYFQCVYYIMALQQESPEQKKARKVKFREFCKQKPDTEGCDEILEEEVNTDAIAELGGMTLLISCLCSSAMITIIVILMMAMRKK